MPALKQKHLRQQLSPLAAHQPDATLIRLELRARVPRESVSVRPKSRSDQQLYGTIACRRRIQPLRASDLFLADSCPAVAQVRAGSFMFFFLSDRHWMGGQLVEIRHAGSPKSRRRQEPPNRGYFKRCACLYCTGRERKGGGVWRRSKLLPLSLEMNREGGLKN